MVVVREGDVRQGRKIDNFVNSVFCILSVVTVFWLLYCCVFSPVFPLCNLWFFCCKEGGIYRDETDSFEVEEDGYVDKKL
jgi:hypothetical protein